MKFKVLAAAAATYGQTDHGFAVLSSLQVQPEPRSFMHSRGP